MIILIIKHKAASGVGPANGYPAGQVAHIFDTFEQAHDHIKKVEKFPMFDGARIFDGDEDILDHRTAKRGQDIIDLMKAIGKAEDTIWFNDGTTVFEQLWGMYLECGGEESALVKEFPELA